MRTARKGRKLIILASAVVLLSLLLAAPVFAEGEAPPDETEGEPPAAEEASSEEPDGEAPPVEPAEAPPEEAAEPPAEEEPPVEEPEVLVEEEIPAVEDPPAEELPAEESPTEEAPSAEDEAAPAVTPDMADDLAENDLTLAGADGEALDMASGDSAQALSAADPYFKVGTTTYRFFESASGCDPYPSDPNCHDGEANPIQAAIDYIMNNGTVPSDRKIYVEGDDYTGNVNLVASLPNLGTIDGLIGVDGSANTTIDGDVYFAFQTNGITLQGFTINGSVTGQDTAGTVTLKDVVVNNIGGDGITLGTDISSAIVLDGVSSNGNNGHGAYIDNSDAGIAYNITIKNSYFDDNDDGASNRNGLWIQTLGKVTMENISASRNRGAGIYMDTDFSSLKITNAVLVGNDAYTAIPWRGLYAETSKKATITLQDVYAAGDQDVSQYPIALKTAGNVTVKNTSVLHNLGNGMQIDNTAGTGYVKIYDSQFIDNDGIGLFIYSKGTVYLSSVKANENNLTGVQIDNCQVSGGVCTGKGTVTVTSSKSGGIFGANEFNNNGTTGLSIVSGKSISLTNVTADENTTGDGINLDNSNGSGGITIKKTIKSTDYFTYNNSTSSNGDDGLEVLSSGTIRVEYLAAGDNDNNGVALDNDGVIKGAPAISVRYSEIHENGYWGLNAQSKGTISLMNVSANKNGLTDSRDGVLLWTMNGTGGGVSIKGTKGYTCQFNENSDRGIEISAKGAVTLSSVEADKNVHSTRIENYDTASAKNVKISKASFSGITSGAGLEILTKGSTSLSDVAVDDNDLDGAVIDATYGTGNVTIKRSTFNRNDVGGSSEGLEIASHKNVTLDTISASDNGGHGVNIDNCQDDMTACVGSGNVSMKSKKGVYNTFNDNGGYGLVFNLNGNVSLSNIQASGNSNVGMEIVNNFWEGKGKVNISASSKMRSTFENNGDEGLIIASDGNISLKYVDAFGNGDQGGIISNEGAPSARTVKVTECTFIKNEGTGLEINSQGTVTLQGVESSDNSIYSGTLIFAADGKRDVLSHTYEPDRWTFSGSNGDPFKIELNSDFFDAYLEVHNSSGGLVFSADGGGSGDNAYISDTIPASDTYTITVTSADGTGGGYYELIFNSGSLDPLAEFDGIKINNTYGTGDVRVKRSSKVGYGVRARDNNYNGLYIESDGAVSISNVETSYSMADGVYIDNKDDAEKSVSLNTVTAEYFADDGIEILSRGNITLSKVISLNNHDFGAHISNETALKPRAVKVSSSIFSGTVGDDGLQVFATGSVTLNGVTAENPDGRYGVWVNNSYGYGNVTVSGKGNVFDNNGDTGLVITTYGDVSVSNFTARDNLSYGVHIINGYFGYAPSNVKLTASKNLNEISGNTNSGFYISSFGTISINKVNVHDNTVYAELTNSSAPFVKKVSVTNSMFSNPLSVGLIINANGPVTLTNVNAFGNNGNGITLTNTTTVGEDVTIKNSTFNDNGGNGLLLDSAGKVTATNVSACDNDSAIGMLIENYDGTEGVTIDKGTFSGNSNGLLIQSDGEVTLKSVTALDNGFDGIFVDGRSSVSKITLEKVNSIYNGTVGINLSNAAGEISITQSSCIANGTPTHNADGLYIEGDSSAVVTISKSTFMNNFASGIVFQSVGSYTLSSTFVFANDLDNDGDPEIEISP